MAPQCPATHGIPSQQSDGVVHAPLRTTQQPPSKEQPPPQQLAAVPHATPLGWQHEPEVQGNPAQQSALVLQLERLQQRLDSQDWLQHSLPLEQAPRAEMHPAQCPAAQTSPATHWSLAPQALPVGARQTPAPVNMVTHVSVAQHGACGPHGANSPGQTPAIVHTP